MRVRVRRHGPVQSLQGVPDPPPNTPLHSLVCEQIAFFIKSVSNNFVILTKAADKLLAPAPRSIMSSAAATADMLPLGNADMLPPPLECPDNTLNLWRGFAAESIPYDPKKPGSAEPFVKYVKDLIASELDADFFMTWAASLVQSPGAKVAGGMAIVLVGSQGCGKSVLMDRTIGSAIIGDAHYSEAHDPGEVLSEFSEVRKGRLLCMVDDFDPSALCGNEKVAFNSLMTSELTTYRKKHGPRVRLHNVLNFAFVANELRVPIPRDEDRRFVVIKCSDRLNGNRQFWTDYFEYLLKPENKRAIFDYLRAYPIEMDLATVRPPPGAEAE